jgi:hypothetical protein
MGYTDPDPWHIRWILEYRLLRCDVVVSLGSKRGRVYYIVVTHTRMKLLQRKEALSEDETSIINVYKSIWSVSRLKSFHL